MECKFLKIKNNEIIETIRTGQFRTREEGDRGKTTKVVNVCVCIECGFEIHFN